MKKKENNVLTTFRLGMLTLAISAFCLFNISRSAKNIVYQEQFSSPANNKDIHDQRFVEIPPIFPEVIIISTPVIEAEITQKVEKVEIKKPEIETKKSVSIKKPKVRKKPSRKIASLAIRRKDYSLKNNDLTIKLFDKSLGKSKQIAISYRVLASSQKSITEYKKNLRVISTYLSNQSPITVSSQFVSTKEKNTIEKKVLASINKFLPRKSKINRILIAKFIR